MNRSWDRPLLGAAAFLTVVGILMVFSASYYRALENFDDSTYYLKLHLIKVALAAVVLMVAWRLDYRRFLAVSPALLLVAFGLLVYVLVNGPVINGSRRWIILPFFRLEVSDVARPALILFLARALPGVGDRLRDFRRGLLPFLGIALAMAVLIKLQPDTGTAAIVFGLALVVLFLAGARVHHLVLVTVLVGLVGVAHTMRNGYQRERIDAYLRSLRGEDLPYHTEQAVIGLGVGGLTGVGLGQSKQKLYYLPEPFTDSIFSILGEETGFVGASAVLLAYLVLALRGFRIAARAPTFEARLLAAGLTSTIALYALLNVGVVTNLIPATGIPLPFVSYGGSNLLSNAFAVGVLLNISGQCDESLARYPTRREYDLRLRKRRPRPARYAV